MNLSVLLGKELREQWRTYRLLAMALVFVAFAGLLSPIVAKVTPELLKNLPTGTGQTITIELPEPTAVDAIAQYLKNLTQTGIIVLILVAMGTVAQERERGTVVTVLSKPVSRLSFLMAKFIALTLTLAASLVLATLACWTYTVVLFGPFDAGVFVRASLLSALYLWVFLAVTFLCSTLTRSPIAAGGAVHRHLCTGFAVGDRAAHQSLMCRQSSLQGPPASHSVNPLTLGGQSPRVLSLCSPV